jgi:hypothetical protein
MDNGLIFPYPRVGDQRRGHLRANHPNLLLLRLSGCGVVGERGNPGGSSRVMG